MANKRSLNRVILVGNVGRAPEITHIPSLDKDVAKFSMVTTEVFMDRKTNQFQETPEWHNIVAWGWTAKKVEKSVFRGSLVMVEGKIKTRKWKDKNDQDRYTTEIAADTVTALDRPNRDNSSYQGGGDPNSGYGGSPQQGQGYGGGGGPQSSHGNQSGPDSYSQGGSAPQAPPEVQINDMQYDETDDPF
ncbi:MAG: single-stranded DNA-binding protein [bacterium]|nr:single-stranded DNA-binding protein [bacterium]